MLKRSGTDLGDPGDVTLYTIEHVASLINLGKTFVTRLVATGAMPSVKIGRARRVRLDDLREFVDRYAVSVPDGEHRYRRIVGRPSGSG